LRIADWGIKSEISIPKSEIKWPIPMLEILAISNPLPISFPNTGGIAVSSHALTANFHIPLRPPSPLGGEGKGEGQDLGKGLGDQIYFIFN